MRNSRSGHAIAALPAVVVLALLVAGSAVSAIREDPGPPESGIAAAPAVGHYCETGPYAKPPKIKSDPSSAVKQLNLCGSNQADEFWTNGQDWVWGLGGNDLIHARNGTPDVIVKLSEPLPPPCSLLLHPGKPVITRATIPNKTLTAAMLFIEHLPRSSRCYRAAL